MSAPDPPGFRYLLGQVMQRTQGRAAPGLARQILAERLLIQWAARDPEVARWLADLTAAPDPVP